MKRIVIEMCFDEEDNTVAVAVSDSWIQARCYDCESLASTLEDAACFATQQLYNAGLPSNYE